MGNTQKTFGFCSKVIFNVNLPSGATHAALSEFSAAHLWTHSIKTITSPSGTCY